MLGNGLRRLYCIVYWCLAIAVHDLSKFMALAHMAHDALDGIFEWHVVDLFCSTRSSAFAGSAVLIVYWFIWCAKNLSLWEFCQCRQFSLVDRDAIPKSVSIDCNCRRWYFNLFKWSCVRGHQIVVRVSCQMLCGGCSHWWAVKIDVLSFDKRNRQNENFSIMITLYGRSDDFIRMLAFWHINVTRCYILAFSECRNFATVLSVVRAVGKSKVVGPWEGCDKTRLNRDRFFDSCT